LTCELIPSRGDAAWRRILQHARGCWHNYIFDHDSLDQALRTAAAQLGLKAGQASSPSGGRLRTQKRSALFETMVVSPRDLP